MERVSYAEVRVTEVILYSGRLHQPKRNQTKDVPW
jgi:hypothetical protein